MEAVADQKKMAYLAKKKLEAVVGQKMAYLAIFFGGSSWPKNGLLSQKKNGGSSCSKNGLLSPKKKGGSSWPKTGLLSQKKKEAVVDQKKWLT